jgi:O-antigen/teichoic acid export membrane protein
MDCQPRIRQDYEQFHQSFSEETPIVARVQHIIQNLFSSSAGTSKRLLRNSIASFVIKVGGAGLAFLQAVVLARVLGVQEYGVYTYVMAWVTLLVPLAVFGQNQLLIRNLSAYQSRVDWGLMLGQLRWSDQIILLSSLVVALGGGLLTWFFISAQDSPSLTAFWIGCLLIVVIAFNTARESALRGLHHVIVGQMPELLLRPILVILLIGGTSFLLMPQPDAVMALGLTLVATSITLIVGIALLVMFLPNKVRQATPQYDRPGWFAASLPIIFVGMIQIVNNRMSILMLGSIKGAEAVGVFAVVTRGAELLTFMLNAVNINLGPVIASLYAKNDMVQLQRVVTRSARLIFLITLPGTAFFLLGGHWFLLLFGANFTQGQTALTILSLGQLMNTMAGSVALLLMMSGHERDVAVGVGIGLLLNILLNLLLIPPLGINGAALAQTVSLVTWNVVLIVRVYQRLGIYSTALGNMRFLTRKQ